MSNGTERDYYNNTDSWGGTDTPFLEGKKSSNWKEMGGILMYEPCNYVSNVAYYHSMMRVCEYPMWNANSTLKQAYKRGFAILAAGSSHMHGSHTMLGTVFDNMMISFIAYLAH